MNPKELRKLSVNELNEKLVDARKELFDFRFRHATAQLENTAGLPQTRRDIARILTVLKEKQKGA